MFEHGDTCLLGFTENTMKWNSDLSSSRGLANPFWQQHTLLLGHWSKGFMFLWLEDYCCNRKWYIWKKLTNICKGGCEFLSMEMDSVPKWLHGNICLKQFWARKNELGRTNCMVLLKKCLPHSVDLRHNIWRGEETEVVLESHPFENKTKTLSLSFFTGFLHSLKIPQTSPSHLFF